MKKEDVVWLNEVEVPLLEDDGWWLVLFIDIFNNHYWFEALTPDKLYIDLNTKDIYMAIDVLNYTKECYENP